MNRGIRRSRSWILWTGTSPSQRSEHRKSTMLSHSPGTYTRIASSEIIIRIFAVARRRVTISVVYWRSTAEESTTRNTILLYAHTRSSRRQRRHFHVIAGTRCRCSGCAVAVLHHPLRYEYVGGVRKGSASGFDVLALSCQRPGPCKNLIVRQ